MVSVTCEISKGCCLYPTLFKIYLQNALNKWARVCKRMGGHSTVKVAMDRRWLEENAWINKKEWHLGCGKMTHSNRKT